MREWIRQMRRGLLELCLLDLLRRGEGYGYQIVQALGEIDELAVSESTVYPILTRLQADGYLKIRTAPSPGGPPRRYFSLTPEGLAYADALDAYWDNLGNAVRTLRSGPKEGR